MVEDLIKLDMAEATGGNMFQAFIKDKIRKILEQLELKNELLRELKEIALKQNKEMREFKEMLKRRVEKGKLADETNAGAGR